MASIIQFPQVVQFDDQTRQYENAGRDRRKFRRPRTESKE